jgi:hypothetical protein
MTAQDLAENLVPGATSNVQHQLRKLQREARAAQAGELWALVDTAAKI